jgi:hypothetical protein
LSHFIIFYGLKNTINEFVKNKKTINEKKKIDNFIIGLLHYHKYKVKNNYLRIMHIKVEVENQQLIRVTLKIKNKKNIAGTLFFFLKKNITIIMEQIVKFSGEIIFFGQTIFI